MMLRTSRRFVSLLLAAVLLFGGPRSASAYLKLGVVVNGRQVTLRWSRTPIPYFITNTGISGVTPVLFQNAVGRAFATWEAVPTSTVAYTFSGFTSNLPGEDDGRSTLGFLSEPSLDRVLASTSFLVDDTTGELLEADIFFNSIFDWSASATAEPGRWDVETIALHEIGHMSGLGHSAIGETEVTGAGRRVLSSGAVMFPIALGPGDTTLRTLRPDDVAGISDLYPDATFRSSRGSLSGQVLKDGQAVFGAHIVAFDPLTGDSVAGFSLGRRGEFAIAGLRPGPQLLRIEPLDDADIESFFDPDQAVDVNFRTKFFERLVVVPKGGDTGSVEIAVAPK